MPKWISITAIVILALAIAPRFVLCDEGTPGPDGSEILLLEVIINGQTTGKIGEFTLRNGWLAARADELRDLGFRVPETRASQTGGLVGLRDLPGLYWTLDMKNQVLRVTATDSALLPALLQPNKSVGEESRRVIESGTGMTLNYDVLNTFASGQAGGTGSFDMRAFSPRGIVSSGWLAYAGASSAGSGANSAVRLDSAYSFADVNTLRRYVVGDFITGGLSWTRPVHLGGVQLRSDFSMRPDLITFPMPAISGSAAVPSTVSILADGSQVLSNPVAAGPFQIAQLPVVSGAGTISMTVTNALGQQVNLTQPFYASSSMLAQGLHTFAVQSGWVRNNWGSVSNDYGKIAGAGLFRAGLTPKFTMEASAETTPGTTMAGAGGVVQIGNLGVLNFAMAGSGGGGQAGAQVAAGAQRIGRLFSIGASAILGTRNYRDIAAMNEGGIPRKQLSGFISATLGSLGSAGFAYAGVDQDPGPGIIPFNAITVEHSRIVSANYSIVVHHMAIYAAEFTDLSSTTGSGGLQVGLTIPFGRRSSVDISASSDGNLQMQVQKSAAEIGQWGYNGYVSTGNTNHQFGEMQYMSPIGLFTAGADQSNGLTTLRMESQGALSVVDHGFFPSNEIYDSFALVDTSPMPHVHVLQENRDVGETNSSGRLLVPDMRSFDLNRIAIKATDIPADVTLDVATRVMRPQDRSGVVVKFPVKVSHGALLKLVDGAGAPLPLGTSATLLSTGVVVPVGYDGDAYVEGLSSHNELSVVRTDGRRCTVAFDYKAVAGDIPSIGPLRCVEKKP